MKFMQEAMVLDKFSGSKKYVLRGFLALKLLQSQLYTFIQEYVIAHKI